MSYRLSAKVTQPPASKGENSSNIQHLALEELVSVTVWDGAVKKPSRAQIQDRKRKNKLYDAPGRNVQVTCCGIKWDIHSYPAAVWGTFVNLAKGDNDRHTKKWEIVVPADFSPLVVDAAINHLYFDEYWVPKMDDGVKLEHTTDALKQVAGWRDSDCLKSTVQFHLEMHLFALWLEHDDLATLAMEKLEGIVQHESNFDEWSILAQEVFNPQSTLVLPGYRDEVKAMVRGAALRHVATWIEDQETDFSKVLSGAGSLLKELFYAKLLEHNEVTSVPIETEEEGEEEGEEED